MAPISTKRRRVEDEVRPKKKFRPVKKQKNYHSSSEDEDETPGTTTTRASDVPRPQPKHTVKAIVPASKPKAQPKSAPQRSILKPSKAVPDATQESSADEDEEADIDELDKNTALNALQHEPASEDDDDDPALDDSHSSASDSSDNQSATSSNALRLGQKRKRNDPTAFATSITKILDTKLTTSKRTDPVLSRSKSALEANRSLADSKLEAKARAQIRSEKRAAQEKGRVRDVLGLETPGVETGRVIEEEKRLKKTAQRGVVRLFNAVRAAQVKAEEAMREARSEGVVGMGKREERVNEMSKQGFLDLISSGGKGAGEVKA